MDTQEITTLFKKSMKMSELIDSDYRLLSLIVHLDIHLGFGEKHVDTVCGENNINPDCFIFLANMYTNRGIINVQEEFEALPIDSFIYYLKRSHSYFLDYRLPNIRRKLAHVFQNANDGLQTLVLDFYDKYHKEVKEHMNYEDDTVFPYISSLISENSKENYSIDEFEERHNDIEGKMNDLKQILMKYVDTGNQHLLINTLMELQMAQNELAFHSYIEDEMVIPRIKRIEKNRRVSL